MRFPHLLREHVRHNLVGYLALFAFALAGTAYALPGRNSVDSGDLRKGSVRTSDLAKRSVTRAKIAANAVDSRRVRPDSLTGADIDESTLALETGATKQQDGGSSGFTRRVVYPAGAIVPGDASAGNYFTYSVVDLASNENHWATLSAEIPIDRVEGTGATLRIRWSASTPGGVFWRIQRNVAGVGEEIDGAFSQQTLSDESGGEDIVNSTPVPIPAGAIRNGDSIGFVIEREPGNAADTISTTVRIHLVELEYTASR